MNIPIPRLARLALLFVVFATGFLTPSAFAEETSTAASAAKVDRLLGESGYKFVKKTDTVWYIAWSGKSLADFKVIIAVQDDLMVTFVTVVAKAKMRLTPEFLEKLTRYNSKFDRVKVGLDDDGDLFVRCDSTVRIMDGTEMKLVIQQVAAATDQLHQEILPSLIAN